MSLILGIHLTRKIYLVFDTRATTRYKDGRCEHNDDLIKVFLINKRISALVAGDAAPASFILGELKKRADEQSSMENFKEIINKELKKIISKYVNRTGKYGNIALIIAGFNPGKRKKIESSALGEAMSAKLVARGDGSMARQAIDKTIINALSSAMSRQGILQKGMCVELDVPDTEMIALEINIRLCSYTLKPIDCYKYIIYHPGQPVITVDAPPELISILDFGERQSTNWQDIVYEDATRLMNLVNRAIRKYKFDTVGGHILTALVTLNGYFIPLGDLGRIKDGKVVKAGSIYAKNGDLSYRLEDGKSGKYRHIESLGDTNLDIMQI